MIVIVDTGFGNLGSVLGVFSRLGVEARISNEASAVAKADRLVLPGVGAFDAAMTRLGSSPGLIDAIKAQSSARGTPTLGICLGAQLLLSGSEEGKLPGLGIIPGLARKLAESPGRKIPHTGWNVVKSVQNHKVLGPSGETRNFYFSHSFAPFPEVQNHELGITTHGEVFPSVIGFGRIVGVQFHPEKSHDDGVELFRNFLRL